MNKVTKQSPATTYVVKRGEDVQKFVGWKQEAKYIADEKFQMCDCPGFANAGKCKHLEFKELLNEFGVEELVFFGDEIGKCEPKNKEQITKLTEWLTQRLKEHFQFETLVAKEFVANPANPDLFSFIRFDGTRKKKTLVVGYAHGIMFTVRPV
jgi:hypothetical protein